MAQTEDGSLTNNTQTSRAMGKKVRSTAKEQTVNQSAELQVHKPLIPVSKHGIY